MVCLSTFLALFSRLSLFNFQGPFRSRSRDSFNSISQRFLFVKYFFKLFCFFFSTFSPLYTYSSCGALLYYHILLFLSRVFLNFFEKIFVKSFSFIILLCICASLDNFTCLSYNYSINLFIQRKDPAMFYYMNGVVAHLDPDKAVIDCGGVGYLLSITRKTYDCLINEGVIGPDGNVTGIVAKLFTYYHVREDAAELYGFFTENECFLFKLLISISGVGPKAALSILSTLTVESFVAAVAAQDAKSISSAQGIGLKSAQKIILELKDKLAGWDVSYDSSAVPEKEPEADSDVIKEAINALAVLGYTRQEATKAVKAAHGTTVEDIIRSALSQLM